MTAVDSTVGGGKNESRCHERSIGDPQIRKDRTDKLSEAGCSVLKKAPSAYVSPSAQIGTGVVIAPTAVVDPDTLAGSGTFAAVWRTVDYDSIIQDHCDFQCGSVVMPGINVTEFFGPRTNEAICRNRPSIEG